MLSRSYKIIVALLALSLLCVLLLQAFWINHSYSQKEEEFKRDVYQALGNISARLQERENLDLIRRSGPVSKVAVKSLAKGARQMMLSASTSALAMQAGARGMISGSMHRKDTLINFSQVTVSDSATGKGSTHSIVINTFPQEQEIDQLLDRMMMEIRTIDVSPLDEMRPDTLRQLIRKELEAGGMFIPFEFMLRKEDPKLSRIMARSEAYDEQGPAYKADLSGKRVFSDHNFLYLQFPEESGLLLARMKNLIALSALFSLVMIAVFGLTLRSILRQKKLGDMKNDFINNMTHELKTPIATMSLALDALANPQVRNDDGKFGQYTAILKEENRKLNAHVEHVLQMARLDRGDLQLHKTAVDLNELVAASIKAHRLQIDSLGAALSFLPERPALPIMADAQHLLAVINNLLDNALKYSQQPCRILIRTRSDGMDAELRIADNGIGIEPQQQQKVFEKFYRAQGGDLHDTKGFGLGLSYARSVIDKHGGSIGLKSEKHKGSEFIIKLPVYES